MGTLACNNLHVAQTGQVLECTVILGSPGRDCQGHGICMVLPDRMMPNVICLPQKGCFEFLADKTLILEFKQNEITELIKQKHFKNSHFLMEDNFILPKWLRKKMNIPSGYIEKGAHRVIQNSISIIIEFKYNTY